MNQPQLCALQSCRGHSCGHLRGVRTLEKGLKKADICGVSSQGPAANAAGPFGLSPMEARPIPAQRQEGWPGLGVETMALITLT